METVVYKFPSIKKQLAEKSIDVVYDYEKPAKLIKYGFNHAADELNIVELTSDSHYRAGLNYDFETINNKDFFPTLTHAEFWEILLSFELLSSDQTIKTSHPEILEDIIERYGKLVKKLTKVTINKSKKNNNLVIYKYSDVEIDESVSAQLILKDLSDIVLAQSTGSNMAIQLASLHTEVMIDLVYYLSTQYEMLYLFRPNITSNLSCSSYLICTNLLKVINLPEIEQSSDKFVIKLLDRSVKIPPEFTTCIQCFNSEIIPQKIVTFNKIKTYLDSKVYEGATYQEMIVRQNENIKEWIDKYINNIKDIPKSLSKGLDRTSQKCDYIGKLNSLFN